jgi:outer membrane protein
MSRLPKSPRTVFAPLLASGLALSSLFVGAEARAQQKIAIVDIQRAVAETTEGKRVLTDLQGKADKKKKELETRRDEIQKMGEELKKQESVLRPEVFQKKRQEFEQKAMQFQESVMRTEQDFQQEQMRATQPIQEKVYRAINLIATRERFNLVLNSAAVVWPQQSEMDITNEVIRKANEGGAAAPATPAAQKPATPAPAAAAPKPPVPGVAPVQK